MAVKWLVEVAGCAWVGRGLLGAWLSRVAPASSQHNVFLWVLDTLASPVVWVQVRVCPKAWRPSTTAALTGLVLLCVWLGATAAKVSLCLDLGVARC